MESKKIIVNAGKYKFQITDNKMVGRGARSGIPRGAQTLGPLPSMTNNST